MYTLTFSCSPPSPASPPPVQDRSPRDLDEASELLDRRRIDPVLGIPQGHAVPADRLQHGGNVLPGTGAHLRPRDPVADRLGIARLAEVAGQGFLDDHV